MKIPALIYPAQDPVVISRQNKSHVHEIIKQKAQLWNMSKVGGGDGCNHVKIERPTKKPGKSCSNANIRVLSGCKYSKIFFGSEYLMILTCIQKFKKSHLM
jgi:hypothetical protein